MSNTSTAFLNCTYIIHQRKLSVSVTMVSKIIKSIKVYFKYVGMHTYKLNVLCFKQGIADVMLAKQIHRSGRKCIRNYRAKYQVELK